MHSETHPTFFQRFSKNILSDLVIVREVLGFIIMTLMGILIWLFDFAIISTFFSRFIFQPFLIYFIGTYLTNIPHTIVIIMAFFPVPFMAPILALAFIFMLAQ
ncbi:MAG: hypothetical protein WC444_00100 [Candidatus Paceibacterota bacterium]